MEVSHDFGTKRQMLVILKLKTNSYVQNEFSSVGYFACDEICHLSLSSYLSMCALVSLDLLQELMTIFSQL
jgi:hypothetical protein